ncbi:MAG: lipid-A-disaccharide synthase N-terminal domain-containing protein [Verrucomicrobiota bacterium]
MNSLSRNRWRVIIAAALLLIVPTIAWWVFVSTGLVARPGEKLKPPFNLSDRIVTIDVREGSNGELVARFGDWEEGEPELTGDEFFTELMRRNRDQPWIYRFLDVTSIAGVVWVIFGFAAQGVFAARLIVQWRASEKAKASIVPTSFWWISLLGASMTMIYFIWRREPVGVAGQISGWLIYIRNLWLIYRPGEAPAEEP